MRFIKSFAAALVGVAAIAGAIGPAHAEDVVLKLWARADRSGPLRAGNIVAAAETLNAALKAAGSDKVVKVNVHEGPATGFDADAPRRGRDEAKRRWVDWWVSQRSGRPSA
jgi:inositol-phosphate transport system substrate-binding protein